jgi:ElaB/YqjD/DUF883 family membrane-anchored ribosome-binding protein
MRRRELRGLAREMTRLMHETEQLVQTVAHDASAEVTHARTKAEQSLRQARRHLQGDGRRALRRAGAMMSSTREQVRSNPWQTLGVAAGIGLLVGYLLKRR